MNSWEVYLAGDEICTLCVQAWDIRLLYLGDDQRGVALEVMAIEVERDDDSDDLLVIHAMKLRTRYLDQYIEALPCRR